METVTRRSDYSLESQLYQQAYEFEFSQAIRILEALNSKSIPFGEGSDPLKEALQIQANVTLSAPASDLHAVIQPANNKRPILVVNFIGIAGIQGPLPTPYTELIIDSIRQKDHAGRDFLDIFNHRLSAFWHRVRKKFVLGMDHIPPEKTDVGKSFLDLIGINNHNLRNKIVGIPDRSLLAFAPLFWQSNKSTVGLYQLLKNYFNTDIQIEELQGQWRLAIPEDLTLIGNIHNQYNSLGKSTILGRRSWDQAAEVRIIIKDLSWRQYIMHLPGQHSHVAMANLAKFYAGVQIKLQFYAHVKSAEIPSVILGRQAKLGQTTWLTRGEGRGFDKNPFMRLSASESIV